MFNNGRNSSGHIIELKNIKKPGLEHGLNAYFYLPENSYLKFYIGENFILPVENDVVRFIEGGLMGNVVINQVVDQKIDRPDNPCVTHSDISLRLNVRRQQY